MGVPGWGWGCVMVMAIVFDTRERVGGGVFVSQAQLKVAPLSLSECFTGVREWSPVQAAEVSSC